MQQPVCLYASSENPFCSLIIIFGFSGPFPCIFSNATTPRGTCTLLAFKTRGNGARECHPILSLSNSEKLPEGPGHTATVMSNAQNPQDSDLNSSPASKLVEPRIGYGTILNPIFFPFSKQGRHWRHGSPMFIASALHIVGMK